MMPTRLSLTLALALAASAATQTSFPQADIATTDTRASLYLPDPRIGSYRSTRFDWSGIITSLASHGHTYFGQWYPQHDPLIHDAITGPVEEFLTNGAGLGYAEVKAGERFVKIGVGALVKPEEQAYSQFKTYAIADPGVWIVKRSADQIEFIHTVSDTNGYGYEYHKTVRVVGRSLTLYHVLRNTGRKPIATSVYEHNFFMIDNEPTGPNTVVHFQFTPRPVASLNGLAEVRGHDLVYPQELQGRQTVSTELTGFGPNVSDYDISVENLKTHALVRQTSDRPLSKVYFWSPRSTVCPEAYIDLSVAPGAETTWRISYEFIVNGETIINRF